jgi:hypothetical protein
MTSVTVDVTMTGGYCAGVPSIDGIFLRVENPGTTSCSAKITAKKEVVSSLQASDWGADVAISPGVHDILKPLSPELNHQYITVYIELNAGCTLNVYEIAFNGRCAVSEAPSHVCLRLKGC